jgi:hypothetical protein
MATHVPAPHESQHAPADVDVDLVVLDVKVHAAGFYANRTRTYFVTQGGSVYLLRAPGQPATLQREDDLPLDCHLTATRDEILVRLAEAADLVERRGARRTPTCS